MTSFLDSAMRELSFSGRFVKGDGVSDARLAFGCGSHCEPWPDSTPPGRYARGVRALMGGLALEPLLAVVLWGGVYPGAKLGLREIPVLTFTALRIVLATTVLLAASGAPARLHGLVRPLLNAGAAQTAFQLLLVASVRRTTAGNSAILLAAAPLITATWLALARRQTPTARQIGGLLLGIAGVALIVRHAGAGSDPVGDAIALAAAGAWAWYGIAIGPVVEQVGARRATGLAMAIAAVVVTPIALPELVALPWRAISWTAWAGLVYGATVGMVVAMTLWGRSVARLGPTQTMIHVYIEPVSAVVIAAVLLGESLTIVQALGAALTFAAVWIASTRAAPGLPAATT
jgi:drug/metabolite transporter (DMT)-like permease